MAIAKGANSPKKGMNRSSAKFEITESEYTFAFNANFHDEHGTGQVNLQNEPSNIYCSGFKDGYKVVGHKFHLSRDRTYFFLTNPDTGCSEIGYISSFQNADSLEAISEECGCDIKIILENPLEDIQQSATCTYTTLISDFCEQTQSCTGCLNFDIDRPIHESNIIIKDELSGSNIYWTDGNEPQRYLQIDNLDIYTQDVDDCTGEVVDTCFQCDKLRIFPLYDKLCLEPEAIQGGGNLRAGMYEVLAAYSDFNGNEISDYYSKTNLIPIHDPNNNVLDQTNLDYQTNLAIGVGVSDLDKNYEYFKVVVVYRSGLDASVTIHNYGVYSIDTEKVTISTLVDKTKMSLLDIISKRPVYKKAQGLAEGNGHLFQYGLESHREINLQPVINLAGAFVKWVTVQAKESLYKDGVAASNYLSYMRDEVVPASIKFYIEGGYETPNFVFIPRPPTASEIEELGAGFDEDSNTRSILKWAPSCSDQQRNKRWQFENTAEKEGDCLVSASTNLITVIREEEISCFVTEASGELKIVATLASGTLVIETDQSLADYINSNLELILEDTDPQWIPIQTILNNPGSYPGECDPEFPDNCDSPIKVDEEILVIGTESESSTPTTTPFSEQTRVHSTSCTVYVLVESTETEYEEDTDFESDYMAPGATVYLRLDPFSNKTCALASPVPLYASSSLDNAFYLQNKGSIVSLSELQTVYNSSATGPGYSSKVHTNALWFSVLLTGDINIFEISFTDNENPDSNTGISLRLTVFDGCSTSDMPSYSRIVSDVTSMDDINKYIELLTADFSGTEAIIAIDSAYVSEFISPNTVYRLAPPSGCVNVFTREVLQFSEVSFTNLTFGKKVTYKSDCEYSIPELNDCNPQPHEFGKFSYWESELKYPCNGELYDSSKLNISPDDIPSSIKTEFEEYFSDGVSSGLYLLNSGTDYRDKPIRHYKFPCSIKVPFMSSYNEGPEAFVESVIYPIGFSIDPEVIRTFLDIAVTNGLLTLEERNSITKYEIFRGDRSTDKSVIAKGLVFDIYEYEEVDGSTVYYPNFPLNSLGADVHNGLVLHRGGSSKNNLFTFHSPDTSFYKPTLPPEIKIEGYQMGHSETYYNVVEDHPTYVIISSNGFGLALSLSILEVVTEITIKSSEYVLVGVTAGTWPGVILGAAAAILASGSTFGILSRVGELRYQWIDTIRNLGHPEQFAYYSATTGFYNRFLSNPVSGSILRGLSTKSYIKEGRWNVAEESTGNALSINNLDRSDSVFLGLGSDIDYWINYPTTYSTWDNALLSLDNSSKVGYSGIGKSPKLTGRAASPYTSLKQYLPSQYGSISSINWFNTGYCGDINKVTDCDPIFGGDTYISRFSPKRKFPYFTNNAFGLAPLTPYKYSNYTNINPNATINKYFIDYLVNDPSNSLAFVGVLFPTPKSQYELFSDTTPSLSPYIKPPAKFFLFSYGFPYFLVESTINCNYRYAKIEPHENFYPNIKDTLEFTQEKNVSIRQPNTYFYNSVYSTLPTRVPWRLLPTNYDSELYTKLSDLSNNIIYSDPDKSENSLVDPWLNYRPLNSYQFPTSYGRLVDVDGIESEQLLGRFENGLTIFGAIDVLRERSGAEDSGLGTGGIFSGRNINFNKTDLGYAGTQHVAKVSCEFGHFWADARRGEVFGIKPNGKGIGQITEGIEEWFKEHLPFKILKDFPEITDQELDNNFKGLGLIMAWDARSKRIFLTKLDYKVVPGKGVRYELGKFYGQIEEENPLQGMHTTEREVFLYEEEFFTNCSFTIAYSPLTERWISYYGFHPNYYVGYEGYFQTGKNYAEDESELGIWSHLPFLSSYQVFYGKLQPFIIEYAIPAKGVNSTIQDISYWLDVRKYYNKYDVSDISGNGYNKAFVYNNYQNTGQLNLVYKDKNDLSQEINYPQHNIDSIDILQSEIAGEYSFNYLYNTVKNERSGLPIWLNDCNQIHKELNLPLLNMDSQFKDRLKGDYFLVRLRQDAESRYKMIHRFSTDKRDFR